MRTNILLVLALFSILSFSCRKQTYSGNYGRVYYGTVVKSVCGSNAVQFTDGSPFGQINWIDPSDSTVYNNIFTVANSCTWGWRGSNNNIKFRFVPFSSNNCVMCLAFAPTPDSAYSIQVIN